MFSLIKSVLKSLELYLSLKNKLFYLELRHDHEKERKRIIQELEDIRGSGGSPDRADLLPSTLNLIKGNPIETSKGIYTPQADEIWHSDARFRRLERQLYFPSGK